jgi:hypothetical protein
MRFDVAEGRRPERRRKRQTVIALGSGAGKLFHFLKVTNAVLTGLVPVIHAKRRRHLERCLQSTGFLERFQPK